jgi:hypothetical protein
MVPFVEEAKQTFEKSKIERKVVDIVSNFFIVIRIF